LSAALNGNASANKNGTPGNPFKDGTFGSVSPTKKIRDLDSERDAVTFNLPPPQIGLKPVLEGDSISFPRHSQLSSSNTALTFPTMPAHNDRLTSSINSGDFQILAGQLTSLLNISSSLQKEMNNLSRRSKDNATDLLSLKEATSTRDEDIRKSLKDLVNTINVEALSGNRRLAIAGHADSDGGQAKSLAKYATPPDFTRNFLSDAEEVLEKSRERRKSVGREVQHNLDQQALEKIARDMANKENQTKILDGIDELQTELLAQGKDITGGLETIISGIRNINLTSPNNAVIPYGESTIDGKEDDVMEMLKMLKEGVKEQVKDVQASLLNLNNSTSSKFDHLHTTIGKIDQNTDDHFQQGEDIKRLVNSFQDDLHEKEKIVGNRLDNLMGKLHEIAQLSSSQSGIVSSSNVGGNENNNLKMFQDITHHFVEEVEGREKTTQSALEIILLEIQRLPDALSQFSSAPSQCADNLLDRQAKHDNLVNIVSEIKRELVHVQDDITGREKVTEKALEIILRETCKLMPSLDVKLTQIQDQSSGHTISSVEAILRKEVEYLFSGFSGIEKIIEKATSRIIGEVEKVNAPTNILVKSTDGGHHFDGSVAAVSAIGAMGKDLKKTVENLQSDINSREEVTEKALEIILREIGTINKVVAGVPSKITENIVRDIQHELSGQEKHTEKAMEIILREVAATSNAIKNLQSNNQQTEYPAAVDKDLKFTLETVLTRSNRTADNSASILELLETFHTSSTGTTQATYLLLQALEKVIKEPILSTNTHVSALQEQFVSANSNTGKSLVEVAKFLDDLGATASLTVAKSDLIKSELDDTRVDIQKMHGLVETSHIPVIEVLDNLRVEVMKLEDVKKHQETVGSDVKGLIESVAATQSHVKDCFGKSEAQNEKYTRDTLETHDNIRAVKDAVHNLGSDEGAIAKILTVIKDMSNSLGSLEQLATADTETKRKEQKDHHDALANKLEALSQMLQKVEGIDHQSNHTALVTQLTTDTTSQKEFQTSLMGFLDNLNKSIKDIEATSTSARIDDADFKAKLEVLLNHSAHQAQFFSQMGALVDMKQQLAGSSSKLSTFLETQTELLQTTSATEKHAAAEATLALERALAEKTQAETITNVLREEESTLRSSLANLKEETSQLATEHQRMKNELAAMEMAISIRREEMMQLETRAEILERRVMEGVINQSRTLLLAKSSNNASKPLKRIPNPPESGSIRSKKAPSGGGRRILSLSQVNANQPAVPDIRIGRTPSSGSNIMLGMNANGNALKRSVSMKTGASEAARRASWNVLNLASKDNDKENIDDESSNANLQVPIMQDKPTHILSELDEDSVLSSDDTVPEVKVEEALKDEIMEDIMPEPLDGTSEDDTSYQAIDLVHNTISGIDDIVISEAKLEDVDLNLDESITTDDTTIAPLPLSIKQDISNEDIPALTGEDTEEPQKSLEPLVADVGLVSITPEDIDDLE